MANWAVVIGIDRYAAPHLRLRGAVRDALAMAAYLCGGPSPLVDPARLKLLLSRHDDSPVPPPSLPAVEATRSNIIEAFRDLVNKPGGRLFVHFSGHGLLAPGLTGGEALLPAEYDGRDTVLALQFEGLRDYLRTSRFDEQFFFIDACRNTPLPGNFNIGPFPVTPDPHEMRPEVQQFVFCATLRGVTAIEVDERGAFTEPLLRGLQGAGRAKVFDETTGEYAITAGRLLRFVRDEIRTTVRRLGLTVNPDSTAPQEPRLIGEIGDTEATIVRLPATSVDPVPLSFEVDPGDAAALATVRVVGDRETVAGPPIDGTTVLSLAPRHYRVFVQADGFTPARPSWPAELYEAARLRLELAPAGLEPAPFMSAPRTGSGSLLVRSSDPNTFVRVFDHTGRTVASGAGEVNVAGPPPGSYRGEVQAPDGSSIDRLFVVERGVRNVETMVAPAAPTPLIRRVPDDVLASPDPFAVFVVGDGDVQRLDVLSSEPLARTPGEPDPCWRSIPLDNRNIALPSVAADGWATRVVVDERHRRSIRAAWFMVRPDGADLGEAERIEAAERFYERGLFEAAATLAGEVGANPVAGLIEAYSLLRIVLFARAGANAERTARADRLRIRVEDLGERFSGLGDVKLLEAEIAVHLDRASPVRVLGEALDRGLPLVAFGARRLAADVATLDIAHRNRPLLETAVRTQVAGWPWTAWVLPEG